MKGNDMPHQTDNTTYDDPIQLILDHGIDGLKPAFELLLNTAMQLERAAFLGADRYERSSERSGYANGYKPKTLNTRIGQLDLRVPQTRDTGTEPFYPTALQRGQRSEQAFVLAIATMYINGVSTRRVTEILEKMCGTQVDSTAVSRAAKTLDAELSAWRERPLGEIPYLQLDAMYEKVRRNGVATSCAVLVATGVQACGHRSILGISAACSEAEVHWRDLIRSLKARGMHGVRMITSDDHEGLKAALKATLPGVPWQRCQFHLQQNASAYVARKDQRPAIASRIRSIFKAEDATEAQEKLDRLVAEQRQANPKLANWLESNLPEGFTVFSLPKPHRQRLRTNNMLERLNRELRRRSRIIGVFPNEESLLRLASAKTMEISDEWEAGKRYLDLTCE